MLNKACCKLIKEYKRATWVSRSLKKKKKKGKIFKAEKEKELAF